ncbi:MAG: response regulator receiver protein [Desulfobacterales bacterium RIFOXYA12_FULL_46_15]|nr:MAG: response regulator receiver protein [Desulfobacterales bacterium RIFOXYA12_FULL_46_15]
MDTKKIIEGKKILIVDDEKDVLESLVDLLDMCKLDTAWSFEEGKRLLEKNDYDVAILDIMGVRGFELLELAKKHNVPALMLTAHALSKENLKKSAEEGAAYYAPKDEMINIDVFLADIITAREKKKNSWTKWYDRLGSFYDKRFKGTNWRQESDEFWKKKLKEFDGS